MKKHLLLISTSFPDDHSGKEAAGSFVSDFASELSQHVKVSVVCPGDASRKDSIGNINIFRFRAPSIPLSNLKPSNPMDAIKILKTLMNGQEKCYEVCKEHEIDHIFALWALPSGYWAKQCAKKFRIPFSTWSLGSDIWSLGRLPVVRNILAGVLNNAHSNYADGIKLCKDVESIYGGPCKFLASSRKTKQSSFDLREAGNYSLAFLGRWHTNKGPDVLLEALTHLSESDWKKIKEIKFAGGGPLEKEVSESIRELKSQNRPIQKLGYLSKENAAEFIQNADWLIIPSRIESIPVIFSDAVNCGTPIIATPVGDLPNLIETYEFGICSKKTSATSLSTSIKEALNSKPENFTKNIAALREIFDLERASKALLTDINLLRSNP